jgi:hypothetical protein
MKPIALLLLGLAPLAISSAAFAQAAAPAPSTLSNTRDLLIQTGVISGAELESIKGTTVNRSVQTGSRSSLSIGSSASFGVNNTLSSTPGTQAISESTLLLAPQSQVSNSIGGSDGRFTAEVSNLRAATAEESASTGQSQAGLQSSSNGRVEVRGLQAATTININEQGSLFRSNLTTLHTPQRNPDNTPLIDPLTGGLVLGETISGSSQTANASSNASFNSNTNVDINATDFVNTFQQAF